MLIGASGEKLGIVTLDQPGVSKDSSLDLVQVSPPNADPVVCKLLDYGKHLLIRKTLAHQRLEQKETQPRKLNLDHLQIQVITILN